MALNQLKVHASAMHCRISASGSGLQILVLHDFASAAPPDTSSRVIIERLTKFHNDVGRTGGVHITDFLKKV